MIACRGSNGTTPLPPLHCLLYRGAALGTALQRSAQVVPTVRTTAGDEPRYPRMAPSFPSPLLREDKARAKHESRAGGALEEQWNPGGHAGADCTRRSMLQPRMHSRVQHFFFGPP